MKLLHDKRSVIGEGPVWCEAEKLLYYVNGFENEIIKTDITSGEYKVLTLPFAVPALGFSKDGRMIVTTFDGVYYLSENFEKTPLYDTEKYSILYGNDSKVGPDGRYYVGTQSAKYFGASDKVDGKLCSIDKVGNVKIVLDGLLLSNGFDWSIDEKYLYHTDSPTNIIKEYEFDKKEGTAIFTGRQIEIPGVDGFTIDRENCLLVTSGLGKIFRINTADFTCVDEYEVNAKYTASCGFCGENTDILAVVTSRYKLCVEKNPGAGLTYVRKMEVPGRKPYLFG